jgi:uncharacterized protein YcbX
LLSVSQLYIYPIKSLGGIAVNKTRITDRGMQYDRRYMLVDENNGFLTQREYPAMALLRTAIEKDNLLVYHKDFYSDKLILPLIPKPTGKNILVKIWDDFCEGHYITKEANEWFSAQLGLECRLVYMPESTMRKVDFRYALKDDITSFADGYPILLIGQSSLDDLNSHLEEPLPMNRFRPNIVFKGGEPFEEDMMEHFIINELDFYGVKLCSRCVITTTNQETGVAGKEPLKTLAKYRLINNKILFGQNVLCEGEGFISIGDSIRILKKKSSFNHK